MICKKCNNEMVIDDKDVYYNRTYNVYYLCHNCDMTCIKHVENGNIVDVEWTEFEW